MSRTVQNVVDRARHVSQDSQAPYRYTDTDYINFLNDAISDISRMRPDLLIGQLPTTEFTSANLGTQLPVDDMYFTAIYMYVASQVGLDDDKYSTDGKVNGLMARFNQIMVGKL